MLAAERNYVFVVHKEGDARKLCEQETPRGQRDRLIDGEEENDQKKGTKFRQTDVNFIVVMI